MLFPPVGSDDGAACAPVLPFPPPQAAGEPPFPANQSGTKYTLSFAESPSPRPLYFPPPLWKSCSASPASTGCSICRNQEVFFHFIPIFWQINGFTLYLSYLSVILPKTDFMIFSLFWQ
jgi:hypothetical protein